MMLSMRLTSTNPSSDLGEILFNLTAQRSSKISVIKSVDRFLRSEWIKILTV